MKLIGRLFILIYKRCLWDLINIMTGDGFVKWKHSSHIPQPILINKVDFLQLLTLFLFIFYIGYMGVDLWVGGEFCCCWNYRKSIFPPFRLNLRTITFFKFVRGVSFLGGGIFLVDFLPLWINWRKLIIFENFVRGWFTLPHFLFCTTLVVRVKLGYTLNFIALNHLEVP